MSKHLATFFDALRQGQGPGVFNPWRDQSSYDAQPHAAGWRLARLQAHLAIAQPGLVCVGEAPGWRGCRYSGIPFTSEKQLGQGIPRLVPVRARITTLRNPLSEPSATIVWNTLHEFGVAEKTVMWNAYPFHPVGTSDHSNRAPSKAEVENGLHVLSLFVRLFPSNTTFVSIGRISSDALRKVLGHDVPALRHPSMGGKPRFRAELRALLERLDLYVPTQASLSIDLPAGDAR